jgi:Tfp pilus assembly protein PilZ
MESGHQVGLGIMNFKILFIVIFNYMKFFDFTIIIIKKHVFKVGLDIFMKIKQMSQHAKYIQIQAHVN